MAQPEPPAPDRFLSDRLHRVGEPTDRASSDAYATEFGWLAGEALCLATGSAEPIQYP